MLVSTDNRMARAVDYPNLAANSVALVTDVSIPGSAYQNASYGMAGLGDLSVIGDYFTSDNFYLGWIALAGLGWLIFSGSGSKKAARQTARRASIKGSIARDQELLKSA